MKNALAFIASFDFDKLNRGYSVARVSCPPSWQPRTALCRPDSFQVQEITAENVDQIQAEEDCFCENFRRIVKGTFQGEWTVAFCPGESVCVGEVIHLGKTLKNASC